SSRMPASLITLPILDISDLIAAANCADVPPTTSTLAFRNFSFTSGLLITRTTSWFSRVMIAAGVLAGASRPVIAPDSYPARPEAATVGKSGTNADGCALPTAKALTLPALMYGATDPE